jgi:hypothetical protein
MLVCDRLCHYHVMYHDAQEAYVLLSCNTRILFGRLPSPFSRTVSRDGSSPALTAIPVCRDLLSTRFSVMYSSQHYVVFFRTIRKEGAGKCCVYAHTDTLFGERRTFV